MRRCEAMTKSLRVGAHKPRAEVVPGKGSQREEMNKQMSTHRDVQILNERLHAVLL